jgi:hypothetical protein
MKSRVFSWLAVMSLFAPLATPFRVIAQEQSQTTHQRHYNVKDLGTLGGAYSFGFAVNNLGAVFGGAATAKQTDFVAQTTFAWDGHVRRSQVPRLQQRGAGGKRLGRSRDFLRNR